MPQFHFTSTEREEWFGKLKFGSDWEGPQTAVELELLDAFRPAFNYVSFDGDRPIGQPIENWVYQYGPPERHQEALVAQRRALKRRRLLSEVRESLRRIDGYGYQPNGLKDFDLDPHNREKLHEDRRIIARDLQPPAREKAPPSGPAPENLAPAGGANVIPIKQLQKSAPERRAGAKRGPKPTTRERVGRQMYDDLCASRITMIRLENLSGPQLCETYKAHRDVCKPARKWALAQFKSRQIAPINK